MIDFPVLKLISKDREIEFYLLNTELNKTALAFVQAFNDKQLPPNTWRNAATPTALIR